MAGGQDQRVAGHGVGAASVIHHDLRELISHRFHVRQTVAKAHLAAQPFDLLPDVLHHPPKEVGTHMRLVLPEDVLRSPRPNKGLHHVGDAGVMGAGGELAVGKGPCAPFAKLHVGFRVQVSPAPKGLHILHPLFQSLSALQQDGTQAGMGQTQGGQQPGGTAAHHHRLEGRPTGHRRKLIGSRFLLQLYILILDPTHHLFLLGEGHINRHHIVNVALFSCVDRLPHRDTPVDFAHRNPQYPRRLLFQQRGISIGR